jgi:type IV pilus biogenesis protein CpaD/CtpE
MKKPVVAGIVFVAIVLGVIIYSSMNLAKYRVEVCIAFNGRTNCKTASAVSEEFAQQTATANACGEIAFGVTETVACEHSAPVRVTRLK